MAKYEHEQTFGGGKRQDMDKSMQPANSYRYARNARLLYNRDATDSSNGHSLAFSNVPGNVLSLSLPAGSTILHMTDSRNGTVVFSVAGAASEIGLWAFDTESNGIVSLGGYTTLYSDNLDPHLKNQPYVLRGAGSAGQDRLNWKSGDHFDSEVVYESERVERIYWTNRKGARHSLNLRAKPASLNPFGFYSSDWSVHAFRDRPDLVFPLLKLVGRGKGRLPSGTYQVCAQYRSKSGVRSAFSPITRRVFVTSEPMDAYTSNGSVNTDLQNAYRSNHHNRTMGTSGVVTSESLKWELKDLDVRWNEVVLAVLYYETEGEPLSITALKPVPITGSDTHFSIVVEITQLDGEEVSIAELSQRNELVLGVGTLAAHQNRLFEANLTRLKPLAMETGSVSFTPMIKSVSADQTLEPTFQASDNLITHRQDNQPLTNTLVESSTFIERRLFGNVVESYSIDNDYKNDKGQVFEWLHGSYFRGQTEEFGVMLFDRAGQPLFVYALPSFTFPEQYADGPSGEKDFYGLTKLNTTTGLFELRIMGVSLSGIRLPVADLYDADGRLNVSGFSIVKRKRIPRLLHQGVVFPVCGTGGCDNDTGRDQKPFPLPYLNYFDTDYANRPNRHAYPLPTPCTSAGDTHSRFSETYNLPYYLNYHSPDVLIEGSFAIPQPGDMLKHVGVAGQAYSQETVKLIPITSALQKPHAYTKSVNTSTSFPRFRELVNASRPNLGDTTRLSLALLHNEGFGTTYEKFDKDNLNLKFETAAHPEFIEVADTIVYGDGLLERNSVLIKTADWSATDVAESAERAASFRLVNYIQATPDRSNETEPYYAVGHFQPLTAELLERANTIADSSGKRTHFEFNNIEVLGGDAYVSLFDFTRIYPYWSDQCDQHDYSISHIIPIESKYNLMLRQGRSFARSAVRPEETACNNTNPQFLNGIMHEQPEDWNYNKALLVDTSAVSYAPQPRDFLAVTSQPSGFCWSPVKQSGQLLDNWRIRLAGDSAQADGSLGTITKLVKSETGGLYAWHQHGLELLPLDPMEMRSSDAGTIITTSGAVFHRGIPISRKYGTQHPDSVWLHNGQMGAWDARMGVLLRHTTSGLDLLSQSENMSDLVTALTLPLSAVADGSQTGWNCQAGVDNENGEVLITLSKTSGQTVTLVYSTSEAHFVDQIDCFPSLYANRGRLLVTVNPANQNQIWTQNRGNYSQFFGAYFPTILCFIVNVARSKNKKFTNGQILINPEGVERITKITHYTPNGGDAQRHVLLPQEDDRFHFHKNYLTYQAHEWNWDGNKEDMRDLYQNVEIAILNDAANVPVHIVSYRTIFHANL